MQIITRAQWGARPPRDSSPTVASELFLHHSVGSGQVDKDGDGDRGDDYMRAMQNFHMDGRGWSDIAYNHAYDPDGGEFYEGRGFGVRPGAQCRHNTGTHSLVAMGDFRTRTVTKKMKEDIAGFYTWAIAEGHLPDVTVQGHRDAPVTGDCSGTTCPGFLLYSALPEINELIGDDMPTPEEYARAVWTYKLNHFNDPNDLAAGRQLNEIRHFVSRDRIKAAVASLNLPDEVADELVARLAQ